MVVKLPPFKNWSSRTVNGTTFFRHPFSRKVGNRTKRFELEVQQSGGESEATIRSVQQRSNYNIPIDISPFFDNLTDARKWLEKALESMGF